MSALVSGGGSDDRPVVAHVNYSFFHSTQSFIYFYVTGLSAFRAICLTRGRESPLVRDEIPEALRGDLYAYTGPGGRRAALWSRGAGIRRALTRLPGGLAPGLLGMLGRRLVPHVRPDADPGLFAGWAEELIRERRAEVLHAYYGPVAWRMLPVCRRVGVPLVVTFLGDDAAEEVSPWWSSWLRVPGGHEDWSRQMAELFAGADLVLAEGPHLRGRLIELGCPAEKVEVQRIAIPVADMPFRPRRPHPGPPVVMFAGRFCEQKGVLQALEAVRDLRREGRELEFRMIGDDTMTEGGYAARVHAYIRDHRLEDCVTRLGFVNHDRYLEEMDRADVFLHPSVMDSSGAGEGGAPTTIIEAQALGMPVVSTLHCDIPNVTVPGQSAVLVPEGDAAGLASAVGALLEDPGRWEAMGRAGRAHVEANHDIAVEAASLEERYAALLASPPPPMIESARTWRLLTRLRGGAHAPPWEIARDRARLLEQTLAHARSSVPFYRRLWEGLSLELGNLPVITGPQVRAALESGELLAEGHDALASYPSTGSTAAPLQFPRGASEQRRWRAGALRAWFEHGYRWRDSTVQFDAHPGPAHPLQRIGVGRTTWISPALAPDELAQCFTGARPDVVAATPTILRRLCRALGTVPAARPRIVFSQGEVLDQATAGLVEHTLGVAPIDLYGLTETGYVGWQCERRKHLHVNAETCVAEVLVDGRPAAPGELGSVVVTDLYGRVAPIVRYDTGDLAVAAAGPCACGRTLPLLGRIEGRGAETMTAAGGEVVTTRSVLDALAPLTPDRYRVRRAEGGGAQLLTGPEIDDPRAAAARLSRILGAAEVTAVPGLPPAGDAVKTRTLA